MDNCCKLINYDRFFEFKIIIWKKQKKYFDCVNTTTPHTSRISGICVAVVVVMGAARLGPDSGRP